jgi:hypothetical protein
VPHKKPERAEGEEEDGENGGELNFDIQNIITTINVKIEKI